MCPVLTHSLAGSLKINSVVENHTISGDDYMPAYLEHLFAGEHPAKYREHGSALRHQELMNLRLRGHAGGHRLLDARRGMTEIRELGSRPAGPGLAGRVGYRSAVNQPPGQEVDADLFRRLARVEQELPAKQLGSRWYREHRGEFLVGGHAGVPRGQPVLWPADQVVLSERGRGVGSGICLGTVPFQRTPPDRRSHAHDRASAAASVYHAFNPQQRDRVPDHDL